MSLLFPLATLALIALLAMPVVAIAAFRRAGRLERKLDDLQQQVDAITGTGGVAAAPDAAPAPPPDDAVPEVAVESDGDAATDSPSESPAEPVPDDDAAPSTPPGQAGDDVGDEVERAARAASAAPPPRRRTAAGSAQQGLEQSLTSRWLVWLGGLAIALGGGFLVKYSIDEGLLSPTVRVLLAAAVGVALIVAGEVLRRRPIERALSALQPSQVPPALTAGGLATLFASIYAAYSLYDLVAPLPAFALLAAVAGLAVALALLQGPLIAVLGLLGGYVTPILVSTGDPQAALLFPYLFLLTAATLLLVRYLACWWLGAFALAGAVLWATLWLSSFWVPGDVYVLGPYLLALSAMFMWAWWKVPVAAWAGDDGDETPAQPDPRSGELLVWIATLLFGLLLLALVRIDGYSTVALLFAGLAMAGLLGVGRRQQAFDGFAVVAAAMALVLILIWELPGLVSLRPPMFVLDGQAVGAGIGAAIPPELRPLLITAVLFAALIGGGAYAGLWGAVRPVLWAGVSAATPVLLLAMVYWRVMRFETDLAWAAVALALAAIMLAAAARVARHRDGAGMRLSLAVYAAGVVAGLSLAATMSLENAWLTVALAVQVPALAWIERRLDDDGLRPVAGLLTVAVVARLVVNHQLLDYPLDSTPGVNWLLYGYGIPALAFWLAARTYRQRRDDLLVNLLEAATLTFFVLLLSLELRHLMVGSLDGRPYSLTEQSLQSLVWLVLALVLYGRHGHGGRLAGRWGWRVLGTLAAAQILLLQCGLANPLHTGQPVGDWPIANVLLLAYALPAVLFAVAAYLAYRRGDRAVLIASGAGAMVLAFVWLSLSVRHAFHGRLLAYGPTSDAEWYSYSLAWLLFAGVLLAVGLWRKAQVLRYASLALVLISVAKVFLFDMSALTGVYRALSFMGLGLALVGVGWLYRRFVFAPAPAAGAEGEATDATSQSKIS